MKKETIICDHLAVSVSNNFSAESFLTELDKLCEKYGKADWEYTFRIDEEEI